MENTPVLLPSSPRTDDFYVESIAQSIEEDHEYSGPNSSGPDEAVFDDDDAQISTHSSPRTSHHSEDDISILPSDTERIFSGESGDYSIPYTPLKNRSPFRNPSSVRALQLDITPPHLYSNSQQRYRLNAASRNSTPRSTKSHRTHARSPSRLSPTKKVRKEYPLVLLHVTLLPIVEPYSQDVLESVLPPYLLDNWKLLREKISDTVLERGILIPHPQDDFELLEERLLESLEMRIPLILKCGHFIGNTDEEDDEAAYNSDDDEDICEDCGKRVRDGRIGNAGSGLRRWNVNIYAANGLMRAGAWAAVWQEMERVDVEISPWIDDEMRRGLEVRRQEETIRRVEMEREKSPIRMDEERLREVYGEEAQALVDGLDYELPKKPKAAYFENHHHDIRRQEVPLGELLFNYFRLLMQDKRNVAILTLGIAVLYLCLFSGSAPRTPSGLQTSNPGDFVKEVFTEALPAIPTIPTVEEITSSIVSAVTPWPTTSETPPTVEEVAPETLNVEIPEALEPVHVDEI